VVILFETILIWFTKVEEQVYKLVALNFFVDFSPFNLLLFIYGDRHKSCLLWITFGITVSILCDGQRGPWVYWLMKQHTNMTIYSYRKREREQEQKEENDDTESKPSQRWVYDQWIRHILVIPIVVIRTTIVLARKSDTTTSSDTVSMNWLSLNIGSFAVDYTFILINIQW